MLNKSIVKSCCGNNGYIYVLDKAIKKAHIPTFKDAGYSVLPIYYDNGLFYVQKSALIATASFGATKISVRCRGEKCSSLLDDFEKLLEKALQI